MQPPVAGRRKGMVAAPQTTSSILSPPTNSMLADGGPSWLDDGDDLSAPFSAGPSTFTPPPAEQTLPPAATPVQQAPPAADTLSFLDFGDESAAGGVNLLQPSRRRPVVPDQSTAVFSPSTGPATFGDTPAFLMDDGGGDVRQVSAAATADVWQSQGQTRAADYGATTVSSALLTEWRQLREELSETDAELATTQKAVDSLDKRSHPLCKEVDELESQRAALQSKLAEANTSKEDSKREKAAEAGAMEEERQKTVEEAAQASRAEMEQDYKDKLQAYASDLVQVDGRLEAINKTMAEATQSMATGTAGSPAHSDAVDRLQTLLMTMMRSTRKEFALKVKPLLSRSIHTEMSEAAAQRYDIFAEDRKKRETQLGDFQRQREESMRVFLDEHRSHLHRKRNDVFGSVKQHLQQHTNQQFEDTQRLLGKYRAEVAASIHDMSDVTTKAVEDMSAQFDKTVTETSRRYEEELRGARERMKTRITLYRERTQSERHGLMIPLRQLTRRQLQDDGGPGASPYQGMTLAMRELQEAAQSTCDRLNLLRIGANAESDALRQRHGRGAGRQRTWTTTPTTTGPSKQVLAAIENTLADSTGKLGLTVGRFGREVAATQEQVAGIAKRLREKRERLGALHSSLETTRRGWEGDIRHALSNTLRPSSLSSQADMGGIADREALTIAAMHSLADAAMRLKAKTLALHQDRLGLYHQLEGRGAALVAQRERSSSALGRLFVAFEQLQSTAVSAEGLARALELTTTDLAAIQSLAAEDRAAIAARKAVLAAQAERIHKESKRLQKKEKILRQLMVLQGGEGASEQLPGRAPQSPIPVPFTYMDINSAPWMMKLSGSGNPPRRQDRVPPGKTTTSVSPSPVPPGHALADRHPLAAEQPRHQPHSSGSHTSANATMTSDFSTDLIPVDDDSLEDFASIHAALGLDSGMTALTLHAVNAQRSPSAGFRDVTVMTADPPLASTTHLARSLTTPSSLDY